MQGVGKGKRQEKGGNKSGERTTTDDGCMEGLRVLRMTSFTELTRVPHDVVSVNDEAHI